MKGRFKTGIILLLVVMMTIPAFGMPTEVGGRDESVYEYASDRIIVKFAENVTALEKKSIRASYNLEIKRNFKMGAESLVVHGNLPVEKLVEVLNRMDKVEYAELDYILKIPDYEVEVFPNDPYDDSEWYLWGMDNIDAPEAWALDQGNPEVIVAVIDTGIDRNHVELDGNIWINEAEANGVDGIDDNNEVNIYPYIDDVYGWDFINDDADPFDDNDHGTHVAGTIAAEGNGIGVVGVAPYVKIMALKCFDADGYGSETGFTSDVAAAIEYAGEKGASVINASWGGGGYSQTIKDAIAAFDGAFVAAAGNGGIDGIGDNNDNVDHYPSSYDCENIVAVASIDENGMKSDFSNYGTGSVDIFAPGGGILSTYPNNYIGYMSGTSMATPHVSGVLALMISHEMKVNNMTVDSNLLRTPVELVADLLEGGVHDGYYADYVSSGGRLNAFGALKLTPGYVVEPTEENMSPVNLSLPDISPATEDNKVQIGDVLTVNQGTWTDEDITDDNTDTSLYFTYSWKVKVNRNRTVTVGTEETILLDSYEGKDIFVVVTATDSGGLSTIAESQLYEILPASSDPVDTPTDPPTESSFTVSIVSPVSGARNIPVDTDIVLSFSEAVDENSMKLSELSLASRTDSITQNEYDVSISADGMTGFVVLSEGVTYLPKTKYTLTVNTGFVKNINGEYLSEKFVTSFTTVR